MDNQLLRKHTGLIVFVVFLFAAAAIIFWGPVFNRADNGDLGAAGSDDDTEEDRIDPSENRKNRENEPSEGEQEPPEEQQVDHGPDSGLPPNELGSIMVLMYHGLGEEEQQWQRTYENFRDDLKYLWENGYRPVTLESYLSGTIDLPEGMTPVILTFDDGLESHLSWKDGQMGNPEPDTVIGILQEFSEEHPGFDAHAVFYVNSPRPFHPMPEDQIQESLQWLVDEGFELGNHTHYHADLADISSGEVQRVIALTEQLITESVPDYDVQSLALPYGIFPNDATLAERGDYEDIYYDYEAVLLVGAEPAPSPFSKNFQPSRLPRVQASGPELDRWFSDIEKNPQRRYVSDGDTETVAVPEEREDMLSDDLTRQVEIKIIPKEGQDVSD